MSALMALCWYAHLSLRTKRKKQELLNEIEQRHQKNVFESKLRFFTNIAHEFCTPLTLIYGPCGRILSSKGLSKFVVDYVQMIQTNAERLNNLIHELIEFRRIETGESGSAYRDFECIFHLMKKYGKDLLLIWLNPETSLS